MKQTLIMSLGQIFTLDFNKAFAHFGQILVENDKADKTADLQAFAAQVTGIINQLKLGQLCEAQFDNQFITKFSNTFDIDITVEQLNQAWQAMHSYDVAQVIQDLYSLSTHNSKNDKSVIIYSLTNCKDMRIIGDILKDQQIQYCKDKSGNITQINGMTVHLSYVQQANKKSLVRTIAKNEIEKERQPVVVITPNNIENEIFKAQDAFSKEGLKLMLHQLQIPGLHWEKNQESLSDFLMSQVQTLRVVNICKL